MGAIIVTATNENFEVPLKAEGGSVIVSFKANGGTGEIGPVSDIDGSILGVVPPELASSTLSADVLFEMKIGKKHWKATVTGSATFEVWGGLNK